MVILDTGKSLAKSIEQCEEHLCHYIDIKEKVIGYKAFYRRQIDGPSYENGKSFSVLQSVSKLDEFVPEWGSSVF